jgi:hypothetical protein
MTFRSNLDWNAGSNSSSRGESDVTGATFAP